MVDPPRYVGAKRVVKTETNLPALTALSAAGNFKEKTLLDHWVRATTIG